MRAVPTLMNAFDINNPAPTPSASIAVRDAGLAAHAEYLVDLAQPGGALWHSPLDRARIEHIAYLLRQLAARTAPEPARTGLVATREDDDVVSWDRPKGGLKP